MEPVFIDRILSCSDCHGEFVFTAGEQLFFHDKQFKNDPKRCKPCKSRRSGLSAAANGTAATPAAAGLSRTETRTECSDCGIQTTVPFKPTQGRPVLCRQCFQAKAKAAAPARAAEAAVPQPPVPEPMHADVMASLVTASGTASALTEVSANSHGEVLSVDAAVGAAASMAGASALSSVATVADLASILPVSTAIPVAAEGSIPAALVAVTAESVPPELLALAAEAPEA